MLDDFDEAYKNLAGAQFLGTPWSPLDQQKGLAVHVNVLLELFAKPASKKAPRVCITAATGVGKSHIITAIMLLWDKLHPRPAGGTHEVHVLCAAKHLAEREVEDFAVIHGFLDHTPKFHHIFQEVTKLTSGLLFIDECDWITHKFFREFTEWAQKTLGNKALHIVMLSAHPTPDQTPNEMTWLCGAQFCGFQQTDYFSKPEPLSGGNHPDAVIFPYVTGAALLLYLHERRKTGPCVLFIGDDPELQT